MPFPSPMYPGACGEPKVFRQDRARLLSAQSLLVIFCFEPPSHSVLP
jgi:hypothetical protein